ncbi:GntR family transcriptional regulator [bacterium]|nr:GntR family transcriptional regulator [bacterium]MBU1071708.1 GntR family transcriptional regulator [bacterium]MBU1676392.1 GntR family transcriptional regulator [bacterium]
MASSGSPAHGLLAVDLEGETPIYRQIINGIRRQVADGLLPPGAALPSVRQLATDLEINPNTVSKSYLLLERDGILVSRSRTGHYVAEAGRDHARAGDRTRLDEAVNDFLAAGHELGLSDEFLLHALAARVADHPEIDDAGGA